MKKNARGIKVIFASASSLSNHPFISNLPIKNKICTIIFSYYCWNNHRKSRFEKRNRFSAIRSIRNGRFYQLWTWHKVAHLETGFLNISFHFMPHQLLSVFFSNLKKKGMFFSRKIKKVMEVMKCTFLMSSMLHRANKWNYMRKKTIAQYIGE